MIRPKRVGHLVLNVGDLEAATKFYTEILGFQVALRMEQPKATFLTCGKIHHDLALFKAPKGAVPVTPGGLGLNHFAVQVEDLDELKEVYRTLKENGVPVERTVDHNVTASLYLHDPEGNRIEFFCNKTATAEEGLEMMFTNQVRNTELVLEDVLAD